MSETKFTPSLFDKPDTRIIREPHWNFIVHSIDITKSQYSYLRNWSRSATCYELTWYGHTYVGLHQTYSTPSSAVLSKTVTLPENGLYMVVLEHMRHPQNSGNILLTIDSTDIEDLKLGFDTYEHPECVQYHTLYLEAGSHDFELTLTKQSFAEKLYIYKVDKWVNSSDSTQVNEHSHWLDVDDLTFTKNSISELNTLTATLPLRNEYKSSTKKSKYFTDFMDHVTLQLGHTPIEMSNQFGGYTLYCQRKNNKLEFKVVDSLFKSKLQLVYPVGTPATNTYRLNLPGFGSVYEMVRYCGAILHYPMETQNIPPDMGFYLNFGNISDYNSISLTNVTPTYDTDNGNPLPSLKVIPGESEDVFNITLFNSSNTWDANIYRYLFLDYSNIDTVLTPPLPFNISVDMHKEGETLSDAVTYNIVFAGNSSPSNEIGTVTPSWDGGWPGFKFDLKAGFDTLTASSEYNISKVDLTGTLSADDVTNRLTQELWIDNVMSYREVNNAPKIEVTDPIYLFEVLQNIASGTNHIIYTQPGLERCDDQIVVVPANTVVSSASIDEGQNVITIDNESYDPYTQGLCNQRDSVFNTSEQSYYEDAQSIFEYQMPIRTYESLNVNNWVDAYNLTKSYVENNKTKDKPYTVQLDGNVLFNPSEIVISSIPGRRIDGTHPIKSMTQTINFIQGELLTTLDMIETSGVWERNKYNLNKALARKGIRASNTMYSI